MQRLFFYFSLTSFCMTDSRSIHVSANDSSLFLFMTEKYPIVYVCTTSSLSSHLLMDI